MKLGSQAGWSVIAVASGLALGLLAHGSGHPLVETITAAIAGIGTLWLSLLQLIALPLVIVLVLAAFGDGATGLLGVRALLLFLVALVVVGVLTFLAVPLALTNLRVDPAAAAGLSAGVNIPAAARSATTSLSWPGNVFEAAVRGQLFPLLLFTIAFAVAVTRLPDAQRRPVVLAFRASADAMMIVVGWFLATTPFGVFALSYGIARRTGDSLAGILGFYLLLQVVLTLAWVLLFYPVTVVAARVGWRAFARAVLPAQVVAVTTRSSAAALPALVEGARRHGLLSESGTRLTLPLSVSFFRISEVILNPVKLLFLARVYGVALEPAAVLVFFATVCLFSIIGTGTPDSGGGIGFRMVPVFVAAGIPIEGVMLLEAVETIPDTFATLANVTSQMGASAILSRQVGGEPSA